jgi:hypothetical protein
MTESGWCGRAARAVKAVKHAWETEKGATRCWTRQARRSFEMGVIQSFPEQYHQAVFPGASYERVLIEQTGGGMPITFPQPFQATFEHKWQ